MAIGIERITNIESPSSSPEVSVCGGSSPSIESCRSESPDGESGDESQGGVSSSHRLMAITCRLL